MTNRQKAAILRHVARAAEKEWVKIGSPQAVSVSLSGMLFDGCCHVADLVGGRFDDQHGCTFHLAKPEFMPGTWFLAPPGTEWSARILWLYVVAHAVAEGRA